MRHEHFIAGCLIIVTVVVIVFIISLFSGCSTNNTHTKTQPNILWNKTYGGPGDDAGLSLVPTLDNGSVITGYTRSYGNGSSDLWLVKIDADGGVRWNRTYGGPGEDVGTSIAISPAGGYIIAGYTSPNESNIKKLWLIKTDLDGNLQWDTTYGESQGCKGVAVAGSDNNGYMVAGNIEKEGSTGLLLVKADNNGTILWNKTYDTGFVWEGNAITTINGNEYVMTGAKIIEKQLRDLWIAKTDDTGSILWDKTFGGKGMDRGTSIIATKDKGYLVTGYTDTGPVYKLWLIKVDASGNQEWAKTFGSDGNGLDKSRYGTLGTVGESIVNTIDGGYVIAGYSNAYTGSMELYVLKTNLSGDWEWSMHYGLLPYTAGYSVIETRDGNYMIAGETGQNGDLADLLVTKIAPP
ncbi:MAG TPA: hypothetical protein VK436_12245 [Methanocella sp.]|nr:hypothetical protein [Methanocella sp.]